MEIGNLGMHPLMARKQMCNVVMATTIWNSKRLLNPRENRITDAKKDKTRKNASVRSLIGCSTFCHDVCHDNQLLQ